MPESRRAKILPETASPRAQAADIMAWIAKKADPAIRHGMIRFGIPPDNAVGISVKDLQLLAKKYRPNQKLSDLLWSKNIYEARMLAALIGDPKTITPAIMDHWCRDFDSWAICDTACMHLFDRSPHAWSRVKKWVLAKGEFQKRAGLALFASLALHGKKEDPQPFIDFIPVLEAASLDERNFVKKAVSWALRGMGRQSLPGKRAAFQAALRLSESENATARWIGKDALKGLA